MFYYNPNLIYMKKTLKKKKVLLTLLVVVVAVVVILLLTVNRNVVIESEKLSANAALAYPTLDDELRGLPSGATNISAVDTSDLKFGFNPSLMFNYFDDTIPDEFMEYVNALEPEIYRFPGGTHSNAYRFDLDCAGYCENGNPNIKFPPNPKFENNHIETFVDFVKAHDREPEVLYVLNIFEEVKNPGLKDKIMASNLAAIEYLVDNGVNVVGVELGNESYLYPEIVGWFANPFQIKKNTAQRFVPALRRYISAIRKAYPDMKIGVPMGDIQNRKHLAYDVAIVEADLDIDAFIPHFYGYLSGDCGTDMSCVRRKLDEYLSKRIKDLAVYNHFFPEKEIWVTEWSALNYYGSPALRNFDIENDLVHSDFIAEYNTKMAQIIANHAEIAIYHRLAGWYKRPPFNLISIDERDGSVERMPLYYKFLDR